MRIRSRGAESGGSASGAEAGGGLVGRGASRGYAGTATALRVDPADLILWTTDLSNYLSCPHLSSLSLADAAGVGQRKPEYEDPATEVLKQRGYEHEARVLAAFEAEGLSVYEVPAVPKPEHGWTDETKLASYEEAAARTLDAMRAGHQVIFQGALFDGRWLGRTDFLRRVRRPSPVLGDWSYEVIDAKLAREAKGTHVLQISLYSDLLAKAQGTQPEYMHLALGGPEHRIEHFRVNDYSAYYRLVRRRFDAHVAVQAAAIEQDVAIGAAGANGAPAGGVTTYPEPCEHCAVCDWKSVCTKRWREDDHLSLVAGIARRQRAELTDRAPAIPTLEAFGDAPIPLDPPLERSSPQATERVQRQAKIQLAARRASEKAGEPVHEYEFLLPVVPNEGLAALPAPSEGDVFLDFEADRFHEYIGLEYLVGWCDTAGEYEAIWGLDRAGEKAAFERFVDLVMERLERWPDLHVYHYAAYEQTALKRLSLRHTTRVEEIDRILREGVLVDLYRVVRQGLRASVDSYSIKRLEPFYGLARDVDLREAGGALARFEAALELGRDDADARDARDKVEGYNRDDVLSTLKLRDWLETLRGELAEEAGEAVPRFDPDVQPPSDEAEAAQARVAELMAGLLDGVPEERNGRTDEQQARWLQAQLLEFHRRELKSLYWEWFTRLEMSESELIEDRTCLGGLEYVGVVDTIARSLVHRYRFPEQEHDFKLADKPRIGAEESMRGDYAGEIVAIDEGHGTIDLKRGKGTKLPERMGLIPKKIIGGEVMAESLRRLAGTVIEVGLGASDRTLIAADLLLRRPPRAGQPEGAPLRDEAAGETELDAARRLVKALDRTALAIQGPPGAGKTYTGARMIADLLEEGKRVGITATSHKVINNLLEEVCKVARERGLSFRGIQKADEDDFCDEDLLECVGNEEVAACLAEARAAGEPALAAGTAWLWSREELADAVDVLFVDEAGQFSLANALAVAQAAGSLVMLGDPQQLQQPIKGVHPDGAEASALEHLLDGAATIAPEQGLFLAHTWRLHPDLCAFTSEQFYESKLESQVSLNRQRVDGPEAFDGTGLRLVPVEHTGNRNHSPEEVEVVERLVDELLASGPTWTDRHGETRDLGLRDILIVAPYNAHVSALKAALPEGARVGTVDKFQGQEAPIVIYSMATSRPEDAPRGMEFLYAADRLNVATSRARCVAAIVANPALLEPSCRTPRQMELANGYARVAEVVDARAAR